MNKFFCLIIIGTLMSCSPSFYSPEGVVTKVKPSRVEGKDVITIKAVKHSFYERSKVQIRVPENSFSVGDSVVITNN